MTCGHRNLIEINEDAFFRLDMWNGLLFASVQFYISFVSENLRVIFFSNVVSFFPLEFI